MESYDPLDFTEKKLIKKLWTTRFLLISGSTLVLILLLNLVDMILHIPHRTESNLLGILILVAGVSALAGFILGFTEWKLNRKRALVGIIGNGLIVCGYILFAVLIYIMISNWNPH